MDGIGAAMNVLGKKIAELEEALEKERMYNENAQYREKRLVEENDRLLKKLAEVEAFIAKECN